MRKRAVAEKDSTCAQISADHNKIRTRSLVDKQPKGTLTDGDVSPVVQTEEELQEQVHIVLSDSLSRACSIGYGDFVVDLSKEVSVALAGYWKSIELT